MNARTAALLLATLLPAPPLVAAVDPIFDPGVLHDTRISMDAADWQALRDNFRDNQYYAANVALDGTTVAQVGIRSRGDGSRSGEKPALKIDFNHFVKGQKLRGLKSVAAKNLVQDPSMLRERLAMAVFEAMGIAAPAVSFTRLYVNGEYWGLYNLIEAVEEPFLMSRFGEDGGNLFSYQWVAPYDLSFRGADPGAYVPLPFEPETHEDTVDTSALVDFIRAVNETPDDQLVAVMRTWLDVDRLLTYLAVENAVQERDGLVGVEGMNNLFLYQYAGQRRFVVVPWDKNTTLHSDGWPIQFGLATNVLSRRLLQDPALQQVYLGALSRAVASYVNPRWLLPLLESSYSQIRDAALTDPHKPFSNAEFESAVSGMRGVIAAREADVRAQTGAP